MRMILRLSNWVAGIISPFILLLLLFFFFFYFFFIFFFALKAVLFMGFVVGRNIGWWLFGCWFCDGGEMAEEEGSVAIGVCSDTKLMQDNNGKIG